MILFNLGAPLGGATGAIECGGGVDDGGVGERLGEASEQPPAGRVVLLSEQPDVVAESEEPIEQRAGFIESAEESERVRESEGAQQYGCLRHQALYDTHTAWGHDTDIAA